MEGILGAFPKLIGSDRQRVFAMSTSLWSGCTCYWSLLRHLTYWKTWRHSASSLEWSVPYCHIVTMYTSHGPTCRYIVMLQTCMVLSSCVEQFGWYQKCTGLPSPPPPLLPFLPPSPYLLPFCCSSSLSFLLLSLPFSPSPPSPSLSLSSLYMYTSHGPTCQYIVMLQTCMVLSSCMEQFGWYQTCTGLPSPPLPFLPPFFLPLSSLFLALPPPFSPSLPLPLPFSPSPPPFPSPPSL